MANGRAAIEGDLVRQDGTRFWASGALTPMRGGHGRCDGFVGLFCDGTAARATAEHQAMVLAEMSHRVKNVLATVQGVVGQTLRPDVVPTEIRTLLRARLTSLADGHDLLMRGNWSGAALQQVVERALAPYGGAERARVGGPPVALQANTVETLSMAFHELATNAAKHGALSSQQGHVEVSWALREAEGGRVVDVLWRETGGPKVAPPGRRGFGSQLLERGLKHGIALDAALQFAPEGVVYRICLPLGAHAG